VKTQITNIKLPSSLRRELIRRKKIFLGLILKKHTLLTRIIGKKVNSVGMGNSLSPRLKRHILDLNEQIISAGQKIKDTETNIEYDIIQIFGRIHELNLHRLMSDRDFMSEFSAFQNKEKNNSNTLGSENKELNLTNEPISHIKHLISSSTRTLSYLIPGWQARATAAANILRVTARVYGVSSAFRKRMNSSSTLGTPSHGGKLFR